VNIYGNELPRAVAAKCCSTCRSRS
jgi:hypothetical protein